jgi:cellulose synthase/poly-beta-1,6-N-acetylglucosamine synthase-like glycosyltransferase
MLIYIIFIFSIYFGFLLACLIGWRKFLCQTKPEGDTFNTFVSIVVPVRNEEHSIAPLLDSLKVQDYPQRNLEVIIMDDHSTDQTAQRINSWIHDNPDIACSYFLAEGNGKKLALTKGIQIARGDIILTTDADCRLPMDWVSTMTMSFVTDTNMVIGLVKIEQGKSFFSKMQALEFSSLMGSAMALLSIGLPVMCNGASLAFRKSGFEAVNGYVGNLHIPSGDDEFLMRKLVKQYPGSVRSIYFPSVVTTRALTSVKDFVNQRLRWAGKWKANDSVAAKCLAVFILIFQLMVITAFALLFFNDVGRVAGILLGIKWILECYLLITFCRAMNQRFSFRAFFAWQFLYPLYVLFIGSLSQLLEYEWKGRRERS